MKAEPADATDECERLEGPIDKLAALLPQCIGPKFDNDVYAQTGIYVIRGLFTAAEFAPWLGCWSKFYDSLAGGREVNKFNPVAFNEAPPDELRSIYRNSSFLDVAEQIFGPNLAAACTTFAWSSKTSTRAVRSSAIRISAITSVTFSERRFLSRFPKSDGRTEASRISWEPTNSVISAMRESFAKTSSPAIGPG